MTRVGYVSATWLLLALLPAAVCSASPADDLASRTRAEKKAIALAARLRANAQDSPLRKEVIRLYLVELDEPASAARFVDDSCDAETRKYVPAAAKPMKDAPVLACLELGNWYASLIESAPPAAKPRMLRRAQSYFEQILLTHPEPGEEHDKAVEALKKSAESFAKFASLKGEIGPGVWMDLLKLFDPLRDVGQGQWEAKGGVLASKGGGHSRIGFPVALQGSYEMQFAFTRKEGTAELGAILPAGASAVAMLLGRYNGQFSLFDTARNSKRVIPGPLVTGKEYNVAVTVIVLGADAELIVRLNGEPYLWFRGPQTEVFVHPHYRIADPARPGLAADESPVVFKNVRVRMLTGKARLQR